LTKLARWQLEDSRYEDESKQIDWTNDDLAKRSVQIEPACHAANQPIRQDLARAWLERRRATLSPLENTGLCLRLMFGCATDTVLWLSAASPAELGFCLHHVYGIPYLPGSALKGVARAYGEHLLAGRDKESPIDLTQDEFARIFGSSKGENSSNGDSDSAGHVDFLDGVPANGVNMGLDIMTPHHSSYYGDPYNKWPHDCENPIPVPFLRIKSNSRFEVVVVWRGQPSAIASKDSGRLLTKAMDLLTQGAHLMGVGAKTTSGYGILQSIR
jgi:CRISPR-associated protein Cmr6